MTTTILGSPLDLPCGATLPNRLAKAAMSEGLADADNQPTLRLEALYSRWANSGAGLLFTGNFQVDRWHLERPSNVVLDDEADLPALAAVAAAGKAGGSHFWAQLSHTGRQVSDAINPAPLSPSSVDIDVPRGLGYSFAKPRKMTEADIDHAVRQFAFAAQYARRAGFTGVQLHAAHGYLISQFLSPLSNRRIDRWGGSLENRSRFLLAIIDAVRDAVGSDFPIGIKLNSSDFQKGGFTNTECIELVRRLNDSNLDLLELSGGSLEQPKVVGISVRDEGEDKLPESTIKREAYFVEFAGAVRANADQWDKKTTVTFNAPVEVPGKVLPAGTYVFKLLDSPSDRHIVQIYDADQKKLFATILAVPDYRLKPTDKPVLRFAERAPPAAPPAA